MSGNEQHQSQQHTGNGRPSQPVAQSEYSPIRGDRSFQPTMQAQGGGRRPYDPNDRSDDIPDSENCDQWILGIPAGVTYQEFLKLICVYGRVWSIHVLRDTGKAGEEYNACAMAFFEVAAAKGFREISNATGFFVRGRPIRVKQNRRRIKGHESAPKVFAALSSTEPGIKRTRLRFRNISCRNVSMR
ncbi:hypothetical protein SCUP234_06515 [Seiridium cupressi]